MRCSNLPSSKTLTPNPSFDPGRGGRLSAGRGSLSVSFNRGFPASTGAATFDGVENGLAFESVREGWRRVDSRFDAGHQVVDGMGEGVLPADDMTRGPPMPDIRMRAIGYKYLSESLLAV